ncbi:hypothetical protein GQX73_g8938 [Xylaria multiplex]|uniref:Uncharacterized protein n=1 Tax=Xylaria multiplex TaxID=323545 RepID=A0A7C8MNZ2_9PEZI|nr:hypothetical protein GQX73_g8938 [Xylaria multiplex]
MAHNFDTTSSTPTSSPSDILGDIKIRHPLVKIPSAQKDLLRRPGTWASLLGQGSLNRLINVPPNVLDGVKASYTRQRRATELKSVDRDVADAPEPSGSQSPPPRVENGDESVGEGVGEDASWSQSPESHLRPPRIESEEPDQPFITQLDFEKSPPQPTIVTSPLGKFKPPEFPLSSQGPEDELEVEVPVALTYNPAPINKSPLPMLATPPSAQVVPCTFEQSICDGPASASEKSDLQRKHKPKKRMYKHVPELYRGPKQHTMLPHSNRNIGSTKAIVALSHNTNLEITSSVPDTSSTIIPSTTTDQRIESEKHTEVWDARSDQTLTYNANLSSKSPRDPLAIRTSLYDDFIRAWVEGYLPYIRDCDEAQPPRKALRAIEWYNEIDDDPLFTSRVVTRQNLQSILNFYPNELEIAQLSLGISLSQGPSERSVSNSQTELHAQESYISQSLDSAQRWNEKKTTRKSVGRSGAESSVSGVSPTLKAKLLPSVSNKQVPAPSSFGGIETRPAQHKGAARSLSESMEHNKRVAIDELRSEGAKRIFKGPTLDARSRMWSDSGSAASSHSERSRGTSQTYVPLESTAEKKSAEPAGDPIERRARKLKEHFKKQKAKRDSIASSAPIPNTPPLTQK